MAKGSDGAFYGTTTSGGANGYGTVFRVTEEGELTVLASFDFSAFVPIGTLVKGSDGAFYGTTMNGGDHGVGTIFRVTEEGDLAILASFDGPRGGFPYSGLARGSDGAFYGTTAFGGDNGQGTVFRVTEEGDLTRLVSFDGIKGGNGGNPAAALVKGSDGAFYGTTLTGGDSGQGTVFKVTETGVLTKLHSFDGFTAAAPGGTPAFGSDGNLYGTATPLVVWRIKFNSPVVTTSAADGISATSATLHASVTANGEPTSVWFEYGTSTDYGNATEAQDIGAGTNPVPVSQPLTLQPHTTYYFRAVAQNSEGTIYGEAQSFTTLNRTPVAVDDTVSGAFGKKLTIPVLANDTDADGDTLSLVSFTQPAHGSVARSEGDANVLVYTPEAGFSGSDSFTYITSDGFDVSEIGTVMISVAPQIHPVTDVLYLRNTPVPEAGEERSGVPAGAIWRTFGLPAINDAGQVAFLGKWRSPVGSASAIFVDDRQVVKSGDAVPGLSEVVFKSFKDPVINEAGRVAFVAAISGPNVTRNNDTVLVTDAFTGTLEVVAREGDAAPESGGALLRTFYSVSLHGDSEENVGLLYSASLLEGSGTPEVGIANDFGAWLRTPSLGDSPRKVVREGDTGFFGGETITSFKLLNSLAASSALGRGHYAADGLHFVLGLSSKRQALVRFEEGTLQPVNVTGEQAGEFLPNTVWKGFGLPATDGSGEFSALRATYRGETGPNVTGILLSQAYGEDYAPVVRHGDPALGVPDATFLSLRDPLVAGQNPSVAFVGMIKGLDVFASNNIGIWWTKTEGWQLVARKGDQAAEAESGAIWRGFKSLVLPDGNTGPLFLASLRHNPGVVNSRNDTGEWGVDSQGDVRLLVREGATVGEKTLRNFVTLRAVSGSRGVRRTFNNAGQLVYRAYFTDGIQGVLRVQVP